MANSIRVHEVSAGYGSVQVLHRISLVVKDAETVALLGTNGNGKSTLMKCIMGVVQPSAGRITALIDDVEHELKRSSISAFRSSPKGAGSFRVSTSRRICCSAPIGARRALSSRAISSSASLLFQSSPSAASSLPAA